MVAGWGITALRLQLRWCGGTATLVRCGGLVRCVWCGCVYGCGGTGAVVRLRVVWYGYAGTGAGRLVAVDWCGCSGLVRSTVSGGGCRVVWCRGLVSPTVPATPGAGVPGAGVRLRLRVVLRVVWYGLRSPVPAACGLVRLQSLGTGAVSGAGYGLCSAVLRLYGAGYAWYGGVPGAVVLVRCGGMATVCG